jgi:hypothetical protein
MQKQISDSALLVMVPMGAEKVRLDILPSGCTLDWQIGIIPYCEYLPPGDWQLKGLVPLLEEEVCKPHVNKANNSDSYSDYRVNIWNYLMKSAKDSLISFCHALKMNPELTYLLTTKKQ